MLTGTINEQCMYIKLQKFYNDTANFKYQHMILAHASAEAFFLGYVLYSTGVQKDYTFFKWNLSRNYLGLSHP